MAIDLLALTPHKVSRDLSGYITYIYGPAKSGKTTFCARTPGCLLLAFERGYNALPGVLAQDIVSWSEVKQLTRELKKPAVHERFQTICVDTVDIAGALCEKYVCNQNDVDTLSAIPYGQGWTKVKKEFEETFRTITQLGYAVIFISHAKDKTFKRKDGSEYNQIVPSCPTSYNDIAKNMADLYAYTEKSEKPGEAPVKLIIRSVDNSVDTGCRFKYIVPSVDFSYENVVKALNDAIDKEAQMNDNRFITDDRNVQETLVSYNYDELRDEFDRLTTALMTRDANYFGPRIVQIVEQFLGKGHKVSDTTLDQAEFIYLINDEINESLMPMISQ